MRYKIIAVNNTYPSKMVIRNHHRRAIEKLAGRFCDDPRFLALIISGSVAKGTAEENSDVDFILVATDEEFERRRLDNDLHYSASDICDYEGGYIDGKIVNLQFLKDAAERGSEPARYAFMGAFVAYSHIPELEGILKRIPVYQKQEQKEKIQSFYAQVVIQNWYVGEAEKKGDEYLMMRAVSDLILYGGRLILAHNEMLFPYHKHFMHELERAKKKPANLMSLIKELLQNPNKQNADQFMDIVLSYTNWDKPPEGAVGRFMRDVEWSWQEGQVPVFDR